LRDAGNGQLRRTFKAGAAAADKMQLSPDGARLAVILDPCPGGEFGLWDTTSGQPLLGAVKEVEGSATAIVFAHHRPFLAIGRHDDHSITLWDLTLNREVQRFRGHSWVVNSLAFSPDDQVLASSSWDASVRLWDVATGKNDKGSINGHGISAELGEFSPDGQTLAMSIKSGGITLWNVPAQQEMITLERRVQSSGDIHFSPDGNTLATGAPIWSFRLTEVKGGVQFWRAPALPQVEAQRTATTILATP
jgi:WD40 repeat protein